MKNSFFKFIFTFLIIVLATNAFSQDTLNHKKQKLFIDTVDGAFDVSYYLYNLHGFLPVASPITEPAVGYGAVLAGVFFIPKKEKNLTKFQMPDIVALGGGLTENNTWLTGGAYFGFWKDDHIRYRGATGYADVKLKYYGKGDGFLEKNPAKFTIQAFGLVQQATFRIKNSRFYLGGKYIFTKTKVTAFEESKLPFVNPKEFELINSGFGLIAEYENFDNIFSPNKGLRTNLSYNQYLKAFGSDVDFGRISFFSYYYKPVITNKWISGFRFDAQMATGETPFYSLPFLYSRGIPAMRYQGKYTLLAETEQMITVYKRWSIVGFAGYGKTFFDKKTGKDAWNAGTGFRYLLARMFGLKMGIDIARGPEQWAIYVVFGSAWIK